MSLLADRVARVSVPVVGGETSIGTAFPVARPDGAGCTWLLTARHVVYPKRNEPPGQPVTITLAFPAATVAELRPVPPEPELTFAATIAVDGAEGPGGALDFSDDWILLEATLPPVVEPFAWGMLDATEVELRRPQQPVRFDGAGYPVGAQNRFHPVYGDVTAVVGAGKGALLLLAPDPNVSNFVDPSGLSGGPVLVGGFVVALNVHASTLSSGVVGHAEVAGTRRARPLETIMARLATKLAPLAVPHPIPLPPVDPEMEKICVAAHAVASSAGPAIDVACRDVLEGMGDLEAWPIPAEHTFVLAVQRLLVHPVEGRLARMIAAVAARSDAVRDRFTWFLRERGPAPVPAGANPAPQARALVLDVGWASDDHARAIVTLRERRGAGFVPGDAREVAAEATPILEACAALLAPRLRELGAARPVEVWAPFELAHLAFDRALLPGDEDERDPVGALAPVTVQVRWPEKLSVPEDVTRARARDLRALTLPLPALPGPFDKPPEAPTPCLRVDPTRAVPQAWRLHARQQVSLLLVALDAAPTSPSIAKLVRGVLHGGVPVVLWERGGAGHVRALLEDAHGPGREPLRSRLLTYRSSHLDAEFTVVLCPPDDPIPSDDQLAALAL